MATVLLAHVAAAQSLTRGPYLQLSGPTDITVVFRSDAVRLGAVKLSELGGGTVRKVFDVVPTAEHVIHVSGLAPATTYVYSVELDGVTVAAGEACRFRTPPPVGTTEAFRLFAWGDSGTATLGQLRVADQMATQLGGAALALILGDIIYPDGAPADYDAKYFSPYKDLISKLVVWPVIGNHDVVFDPSGQPWLDAFHTPANNPAGTELYYSFDYANAHFVALDTHVSDFSTGSAQLQWAAADLAASPARWKVAFFHVPPYSGGTHLDSAAVKASIVPVLEAAGVDVVFAGHSHVYERTYLLRQNAVVQPSPNSYQKATAADGTLYLVSGTAGQSGPLSQPNHPLMAFQVGNVLGNTVVDFAGDTLHGYFVDQTGTAVDLFTLRKGPDTEAPVVMAARALSPTRVDVAMSEPVEVTSAQDVTHYAISPALSVQAAQLGSDARTVTLTTGTHGPGAYRVTARGVADRASSPNVLDAGWADYQSVVLSFVDAGAPVDGGAAADAGPDADGGVSGDAGLPDAGRPLPTPRDGGLTLVDERRPWRFYVGETAPPVGWARPEFDDSLWSQGRVPLGYGEPPIVSPIDAGALTLYARCEFDVFVPPAELEQLTLQVDYDDGFVAYLGGEEVARENVALGQTFDTPALVNHESGVAAELALTSAQSRLVPGDNVLAIEVHNISSSSSDLFLFARLWADRVAVPYDGGPRIEEPEPTTAPAIEPGLPADQRPRRCGCSAASASWAVAAAAAIRLLRRRRG